MANKKYYWRKRNPEKAQASAKRCRQRKRLRELGYLPPVGAHHTKKHLEILRQIDEGTYILPSVKLCATPKACVEAKIKELKKSGVLPLSDDEYLMEHIELIMSVYQQHGVPAPYCKVNKSYPETPEFRIWLRAKENAKIKGYAFNLHISDISIPKECPYLAIPIVTDSQLKDSDNYYSIDRIDSSMGYVKGNIQIISLKANKMKNNATCQELLTFAKNVLRMNATKVIETSSYLLLKQ
jgi:hypothetical protein